MESWQKEGGIGRSKQAWAEYSTDRQHQAKVGRKRQNRQMLTLVANDGQNSEK